MLNFSKAITDNDIMQLEKTADEIWRECFKGIITDEQIEYMLRRFLSAQAIKQCIADGYEFVQVCEHERCIGFISIKNEGEKLFLSKLYLYDEQRGKGYGGKMLQYVFDRGSELGCKSVYLTVNRNNTRAIAVYEHTGFEKVREQVADIGSGFVMDDYVMEKAL